jgi:hypothetical protein
MSPVLDVIRFASNVICRSVLTLKGTATMAGDERNREVNNSAATLKLETSNSHKKKMTSLSTL